MYHGSDNRRSALTCSNERGTGKESFAQKILFINYFPYRWGYSVGGL